MLVPLLCTCPWDFELTIMHFGTEGSADQEKIEDLAQPGMIP